MPMPFFRSISGPNTPDMSVFPLKTGHSFKLYVPLSQFGCRIDDTGQRTDIFEESEAMKNKIKTFRGKKYVRRKVF